MTSSTHNSAQPAHRINDSGLTDQLFWLSKLNDDLPRASIVPDFKRTTSVARRYDSIGFDLDSEVIQVLKSLDSTQGISDVEMCLGLVTVLLAKYQREDEMIIGLKVGNTAEDPRVVFPFRLTCDRDATILTVIVGVARELNEMLARSTAVVTQLPQILGMEVSAHRFPLFDIAVAVAKPGVAIDLAAYPVDVAFLFKTAAGHISGRILYAAELYEKSRIERLVSHFLAAAREVALQPSTPLRNIDILAPEERRLVVEEFNARSAPFPVSATLHALFEEQARRTPGATAAVYRDQHMTYGELNERANRVAHTLLSLGLKKGAFVGILLNRSCDFLVAMLGVFKAGGAYVPLDPTYPRDRIRYMLNDSEAPFLISNSVISAEYSDLFTECAGLRVLLSVAGNVDDQLCAARPQITLIQPDQLATAPCHDPLVALAGTDRAYMIYTSGSTGRPKGAICLHNGALNHLFGELEGIGIESAFSFLQTAASSSDISVWQFMAPLLFGGATVIVDYEVVVDPALLLAAMRTHRVAVAEPVPVVLRAFLDLVAGLSSEERALPDLRCMMCTGEALPAELVDRWLALYPEIPIANTYGPTETSDDVTLLVLREPISDKRAIAPIGRPLPNVRVFVVDRDLRPVPIGVPGEICIAGIAVGEGYWRQPEKTAAAFVPCPFPEVAEERMYRTGDLGRWLSDGTIEFLGRIDQQVKIRGFRIEPGEIESVMTQHPDVQDAAVVVVNDGAGNPRLIGYFVIHKGVSLTVDKLRRYLKATLANHMVPAALVPLSALPLTPLGKLDRRALAKAEALKNVESESYVAPRDATEEVLATIWSKVTGRGKVGIHDNFFEIGGDSMLVIQVVLELRDHGFKLSPSKLFRYPTIAELSAHLLGAEPTAGPGATEPARLSAVYQSWETVGWREQLAGLFAEIEDVYPLSATQRGIYFQSVLTSRASGAYIEQIAFDLSGDLDEIAFARAWQYVADTTDVLRTAVVRRGGPQPLQVVVRGATLVPGVLDWRGIPEWQQASNLARLVTEDRMKGFDLKKPPLARVTLVRLADQRWRVLWTYHHIILDGWSEPLLLRAVFRSYDAFITGRQPQGSQEQRYRDFVAWSESQDLTDAQRYWRQQLAGLSDPVSIKDVSPAVTPPSSKEVSHGWEDVSVGRVQMAPLEGTARRNGLTLNTILHGAWALLLHRRVASADVVFGSVVSGRQCELRGIESMRGLVVVTQPLRTRLAPEATVSSWLRLLQIQMAEMREYEHTPLALIEQWRDAGAVKRPLFDSLVDIGNYAGSDLSGCGPAALELTSVQYFTQPLYALTLFLVTGPALAVRLIYDKRRYAPDTVRGLLSEYVQLLAGIAENPEQRVASLLETHEA